MLEVQDIQDTIRQTRNGYRMFPGKARSFEMVLRDYYEKLHASQSPTRDFIEKSFTALSGALNQPGLVDQTLLINYIGEIVRFVENVGLGFEFGREFIDRAIDVYLQADSPMIDLYLAKVSLLRLDRLENPERESTLLAARRYAETTDDREGLLRVLIRMAEYYTEVSFYEKSLQMCREGEAIILSDTSRGFERYYPRVVTNFGMNYTTLFRYDLAEHYLLKAKELLQQSLDRPSEDVPSSRYHIQRTMATVLHYLGRIAEVRGRLQEAMTYYVRGQEFQEMGHEEVAANAFYHLRLGELLIAASLLEQASDHIHMSQEMFDAIQFSSSGRVQVSLAWASIANKRGDYRRAREDILKARDEARQRNFPRGELLCLVKLFWLELQHCHFHYAIYIFFLAMRTWQNGELRRIGAPRLLVKYLLQVLLTPFKLLLRSPHTVMGAATFNAPVSSCICPIHRAKGENVQ